MSRVTRTYSLRRFSRSTDRDYQKALWIYLTNISPDGRTSSNDVTYWVDRYADLFEDEFCVCGFYSENEVIGFAEFVYFREERLLLFDYLVLHRTYRSNGEYFQFVKMIQSWIDQEALEFDYMVGEVTYDSSTETPSEHSLLLVELFKQMGFHVADCRYFQPPLGLGNPQSDTRAHLLISGREKIGSLKPDTLLLIVHTIYYKHYERWYRPLVADPDGYRSILDRRFAELKSQVSGLAEIRLNGIKTRNPPFAPSPPPRMSPAHRLAMASLAALAVVVVCFALCLTQGFFQMPLKAFLALLAASLVITATAFALFYRKGGWILTKLLDSLLRLAGRKR